MHAESDILVINIDNVFILSLTESLGTPWWGDRDVSFISSNGSNCLLDDPLIRTDPRTKVVVKELPIHDLDPQILDLTWADFVIFTTMELIQETPVPMTVFLEKYYPCKNYILFAGGHVSYPCPTIDSKFYVKFKETFARVVCANLPREYPITRPKLYDVLLGTPKFERQFILQNLIGMGLEQDCVISMHPHSLGYYPPFQNAFTDLVDQQILDYESPEIPFLEDPRVARHKTPANNITEFCSAKYSDSFCMSTEELSKTYGYPSNLKIYEQHLVPINLFHAWCSHLVPEQIYSTTWYSIISETHLNGNLCTEKTAKCLFSKRPFILFGGPHMLKHLKDLGFKTFDSVIDESYDQIFDPVERFNAALTSVKKLSLLDPVEVYQILSEVLEHNYQTITNLPEQLSELSQFIHKNLLG